MYLKSSHTLHIVCMFIVFSPPPLKKQKLRGFKEDPFVFLEKDAEVWPSIKSVSVVHILHIIIFSVSVTIRIKRLRRFFGMKSHYVSLTLDMIYSVITTTLNRPI